MALIVAPLFAYTRFAQWDLILNGPRPPQDSLFWCGLWHYARSLAFTAQRKIKSAIEELAGLRKIAAQKSMDKFRVTFSGDGAKAILEIATEALAGETTAKQGAYAAAIARLHTAVFRLSRLAEQPKRLS